MTEICKRDGREITIDDNGGWYHVDSGLWSCVEGVPQAGGAEPDQEARARRDARACQLSRMPKAALIRMLRPHVIGANPLSTWSKDELVSAALEREFRQPAPSTAGPEGTL